MSHFVALGKRSWRSAGIADPRRQAEVAGSCGGIDAMGGIVVRGGMAVCGGGGMERGLTGVQPFTRSSPGSLVF
jgi:hypothetical protein